jgi:predicted regulator of Ras-like GTPase activity (Roadblock/LC7/MglB family)
MDDILREINAVVGINGCFICNDDGQVIYSLMPDNFEPTSLAAVGRVLTQTVSGLSLARRRKVWEIDLVYDQTRLIAKNTGEGCLCIIGSPDINIHFLNLTADLAVKKIKQLPHEGKAHERERIILGLPEAVRTLFGFVNQILQEVEKQGTRRENLSKILDYRLKKLRDAYPSLKDIASVDDRLDVSGLPLHDINRDEAKEGIEFLLHGLCLSLKGLMGEEQAEAVYLSVYDPFIKAHEPAFISLDFGDSLRNIMRSQSPSAHSGVEISLD